MRKRDGIIGKLTLRRALAELADQGVAAGFAAVFFAAAFFSRGDEYDRLALCRCFFVRWHRLSHGGDRDDSERPTRGFAGMSGFDPNPSHRQRIRGRWPRARRRGRFYRIGWWSPCVSGPADASRVILSAAGLIACVSCATASAGERPDGMRGPCDVSEEWTEAEDAPATRRILTNDDVMDMVAKEIEEDVMIDLITACEVDFDVSAVGLLALSRGGVNEAVIRAMVAAMGGS